MLSTRADPETDLPAKPQLDSASNLFIFWAFSCREPVFPCGYLAVAYRQPCRSG